MIRLIQRPGGLVLALIVAALSLFVSSRGGAVIHAAAQHDTSRSPSSSVALITLRDTLQPIRARAFVHQLATANSSGASAIVIAYSTPGGMASSTDLMVDAIHRSRLPVIVWVGQERSRVGGEGLRILAEADAAFMTKDTYLSPLWAEPPRGLTPAERTAGSHRLVAQLTASTNYHGLHPNLLPQLATGSHWFTPAEAVKSGLVTGVALKTEDLLRELDGLTVTRGGRTVTLTLNDPVLAPVTSDGENFLLLSLMNPNLDVLLLVLGLLLIYLEINTPGIVIPGATGLLMVLITGFALFTLPIGFTGVLLCLAALALLVLESRLQTRGVLAALGTLALIAGLALLVRGPIPQLQVARSTAVGAGLAFGGITASLMVLAGEARREKVKTGADAMLGWLAVAQTPLAPSGRILVRGELWNARLTSSDTSVAAGDRVKVLRADGLTLEVTAVPLTHS